MEQKKAKNHHVSFGKSRLARAALSFSARNESGGCVDSGTDHGATVLHLIPS